MTLRINYMIFAIIIVSCASIFAFDTNAQQIREYNLEIDNKMVNFTGKDKMAISVNDSIPAPTLYFKEGETAKINVKNNLDTNTSVHWHGILLPNRQDGVSYLTTPPITPGMTYTFEFPLIHSGTYWYHSHTGLQEQKGVYGAIVIEPKENRTDIEVPKVQETIVLSDWTDQNPHEVLRDLKRGSEYQEFKKGSMQTVYGVIKNKAIVDNFKRSLRRMPPMDLSDVAYDAFLINGKQQSEFKAQPGEKILLRIINAGGASYFYLNYAGGDMEVIAADGVDVKPFKTDRMLMAIAETYDVIITVPKSGSAEFRATAQDGSGHASLFIGEGDKVLAQDIPKPNLYKMDHSHMMMDHEGHGDMEKKEMEMDHSMKEHMDHSSMDHGSMDHSNKHMDMSHDMKMDTNPRPMPPYKYLRSVMPTSLPK
ncbi:MAG: multicopper oxidase domain-containing protein, partial [Thermodesulfobacteriota bacterium]